MGLRPSLQDIRFDFGLLSDPAVDYLEEREFYALMRLVRAVAGGLVWTYSAPGDGSLPDDDSRLARIVRFDIKAWRKVRPAVSQFFVITEGRWHLNREWIAVGSSARAAIPVAIQEAVASRQGRRCTYCSSESGPFEFDHIFPVARGGTDDPSNLALACQSCNRSKQDLTLAEWLASGRLIIRATPQ